MSQTVYFEFFEYVIDELVHHCIYCQNEIENKEQEICFVCELSIELTESLMATA